MQKILVSCLMAVLVTGVLGVTDVVRPSETEREDTNSSSSPRPVLPEGNSDDNEVSPTRRKSSTEIPETTTMNAGIPPRRSGFPVINLFPSGSFPSIFGSDDGDDFGDGLFFNFNPFNSFSMQNAFRRMEEMMREAEERMRQVFQASVNATSQYPDNYDNSTSDIIEINGQKFKLQRTVTKKGNNESSVLVSFTTLTPVNRRKREIEPMYINSFADELHRLKREAAEESDN